MGRAVIQVRGVSLRLGQFAVHDASLEVQEGEYFVLLGPTGAGKTVLLECVAGLHRPQRGEIYVDGEVVNHVPPEQRGLGYLPQDYALFPHLRVARNIAFGMRIRRVPRGEIERKVDELSRLLGIEHLLGRTTLTLSGGEQQRVALARALAIEPKVLLLDEPLSALDEQTREGLCVELRRVHEELGTTTIHVSHNFEETLAVADRIGIIHEGRIRQIGSPEEVFRRPASRFVAGFVRSENILRGRAARRAGRLAVKVGELEFWAADGPEGEVHLTVRPEEVGVVGEGVTANHPNLAMGEVVRLVDKGAVVRVDIDVGVTVVALMGRREYRAAGFAPGERVGIFFDPAATHVFAAEAA
jgi:molybdate transport system ATP-binding protein